MCILKLVLWSLEFIEFCLSPLGLTTQLVASWYTYFLLGNGPATLIGLTFLVWVLLWDKTYLEDWG